MKIRVLTETKPKHCLGMVEVNGHKELVLYYSEKQSHLNLALGYCDEFKAMFKSQRIL